MKNKVLSILLSVLIAFGLWFYVITEERTQIEETFYNIPVIMNTDALSKDLMIISDDDPTISLKLYGTRSTLNKLRSSDIVVLVDLSKITEPGTKRLSYTVTFPGDIQTGTIEILNRQPDLIEVEVAQKAEKEIPIEVDLSGVHVAEGYKIDEANIFCDLKQVKISGPKTLIDQIAKAKVAVKAGTEDKGVTADVEEKIRLQLCDAQGNSVGDVSKVFVDGPGNATVKIPVLMEKEISVFYNIIYGNILNGINTEQRNKVDKITITGKKEVIEDIDDLTVDVDLRYLSGGFENKEYDLGLPAGVTSNIGSKVKVTIAYTPFPAQIEAA